MGNLCNCAACQLRRKNQDDDTKELLKVKFTNEEKEPRFMYPVNLAPAGEEPLETMSLPLDDKTSIETVIGRVYVWQKQDEGGGLEATLFEDHDGRVDAGHQECHHHQRDHQLHVAEVLAQEVQLGGAVLAPDGGLFIPQSHPSIRAADFSDAQGLADIALRLLAPFVADDPIAGSLEEICRESFCFPLPVSAITSNDRLSVLELFHGPTAAFKDVGAGFLAACFARIAMKAPRKTILVATSGDTGAAVAAAVSGATARF